VQEGQGSWRQKKDPRGEDILGVESLGEDVGVESIIVIGAESPPFYYLTRLVLLRWRRHAECGMKSYVDRLSLKNSHDDIILTATTNL